MCRSWKTALRSIAIKFLVPVVIVIVGSMVLDLYQDHVSADHETSELIDQQAALALAFDLAIRSYVREQIRPVVKEHVPPDEFIPEVMSTTFVARSIFEKVREQFPDYVIKFSSENPRNPVNRAGPAELRMLEYFNSHPDVDHWAGEIELNGRPHYAHFSAERFKPGCLQCHGEPADAPASLVERYGATAGFHRPVNEVAALDTVAIPMAARQEAAAARTRSQVISGAISLALLLAIIVVLFRLLVTRRLDHLRARFEQIAADPNSSTMDRVECRSRDEIGSLAASFNAMVDRVREGHELLETGVAERTRDLAIANEALRTTMSRIEESERNALQFAEDAEANRVEAEQARRQSEESVRRLEEALSDVQRLNQSMMGREDRVLELKREVNALLEELNREPKYPSVASAPVEPTNAGHGT